MDEVYIDITKENKWISQYFKGKEYVSIGQLLNAIEDLDDTITILTEKIKKLENRTENDWEGDY